MNSLAGRTKKALGFQRKFHLRIRPHIAKRKALEGITYTVKYYVQNTDNSGYSLKRDHGSDQTDGRGSHSKAAILTRKSITLKGKLKERSRQMVDLVLESVLAILNEVQTDLLMQKGGESDQTEVTARDMVTRLHHRCRQEKGYMYLKGWYTDEGM